jgi:hypothetical protein
MVGAMLAGQTWEAHGAIVTYSMASALALVGWLVVVFGMSGGGVARSNGSSPVR